MKNILLISLFGLSFLLIHCKNDNVLPPSLPQATIDQQTPVDSLFFFKLVQLLENKGEHFSFKNEPGVIHYQIIFTDFSLITKKEKSYCSVIYVMDHKNKLNYICDLRPDGLYTTEKEKLRSRKIVSMLKKITAYIDM